MLLIVNLSMSRWSLTSEFIDDAEDGELSSASPDLLLVLLTLYDRQQCRLHVSLIK